MIKVYVNVKQTSDYNIEFSTQVPQHRPSHIGPETKIQIWSETNTHHTPENCMRYPSIIKPEEPCISTSTETKTFFTSQFLAPRPHHSPQNAHWRQKKNTQTEGYLLSIEILLYRGMARAKSLSWIDLLQHNHKHTLKKNHFQDPISWSAIY